MKIPLAMITMTLCMLKSSFIVNKLIRRNIWTLRGYVLTLKINVSQVTRHVRHKVICVKLHLSLS
jgi:hypothetical protein